MICKIDGCQRKYYGKGYCSKHYLRWKRGYDPTKRTIKDPNKIIIDGGVAFIELYDKQGDVKSKAIIDSYYVNKIKNYKWRLMTNGYVGAHKKNKNVYLHRLILNCSDHKRNDNIDHINRNPLDNRKENLRLCDQTLNVLNSKIRTDNTSGYTGVSWDKQLCKWRARIHIKGKEYALGIHDKLEEAINSRKNAEREFFDEVFLDNVKKKYESS